MSTPIGARVGAILAADAHKVQLLGFGVYDGPHEPPFGPMGMPFDEYAEHLDAMKQAGQLPADYVWKNPRITLDSGDVVWGCQCWWGPEESVRAKIAGRAVELVDLDGRPRAESG